MKTIFCIIGRSATGKDTLTNTICKELNMTRVVSHTTRSPRAGEKNGVDYFFSIKEELIKAAGKDNIGAYTQIGENYYWTTIDEVINKDFYIIDPDGLKSLQHNLCDKNIRIISIYITAPENDRKRRALIRDPKNIESYMTKCINEDTQFTLYEKFKEYDYCIHNVHFIIALEQLKTIIEKERKNIYAI